MDLQVCCRRPGLKSHELGMSGNKIKRYFRVPLSIRNIYEKILV